MLEEKELQKLDKILKKYPTKMSAVLSALYLAQEEKNWLDSHDVLEVSQALSLPVTHVQSIIAFYTLFRTEPTGKYMVQVCTDLPCALRGAEDFYKRLCQRLELPPQGGTTTDGLFTVEHVVCIAACDKAPCLQLNLEYYENLTDEMIDEVIAGLRAAETA